jgi:general secretion pathway protein I
MDTARKIRSNNGTTLLEVLIAIAVASIALVAFISLVITSMDMEDHARKVTEATLIADDKLKEVERNGFPEVGKTEGLVDEERPEGFHYRLVVSETEIEQVRRIDIEVLWDKGKRSISLFSLMVKP